MNLKNVSLSTTEKISLISNLSTMLSAGIPILEAVNSLVEDAKGNPKKVLETLRDDLVQGNRLYVTFAKFPQVFNTVTVNVVKASEEAGSLEVALTDLANNIRKEAEFSDKIKGAMIYPILIMGVFLSVLFMILVVVVPKIALVFSRLSTQLPLPTRVMIYLSDQILKNTFVFAGGTAAAVLLVIFLFKKKKSWVMAFFSSLPLMSRLVKEIDLTRFSRSLYLLLSAGLPITQALELASAVVVNKKTAQVLARSRDMVLSGQKLSAGLAQSKGVVPSLMVKLIEVGEKSGSLDKSMKDVSEFLDYQVSNTLKTLTVVLEPVMLLFVGVFVGGMMLAIIAPIYGLIGQVGTTGGR